MALKTLEDDLVVNTETFNQVRRPGKKKVVIVKEIMYIVRLTAYVCCRIFGHKQVCSSIRLHFFQFNQSFVIT